MRMETFIRKSLGLRSHFVRRVRESEEGMVAEVERIKERHLSCGECGLETRRTYGRANVRIWRDLRLRDRCLLIEYRPFRVVCPVHGVRGEEIPWANRWSRVTRDLAREIALMARKMSWKEVARHFGVDWKVVASVVKRAVKEGLLKRKWKPLHIIGVDEVSRKKGHRYLTLVYDLERGRLLWVGEDREEATMDRFFEWLGKRKARSIRAVCCDMWAPYLASIRSHLPRAAVLFDRFHIVRHLNGAVDEIRREMVRTLTGEDRRRIKKTRFLLLKNPWNLTTGERKRLSDLVRFNSPLIRAYYLKEEFQRFWDYVSPAWALKHIRTWLSWAGRSRLEPMKKFSKMVRKHLRGILEWTKLRVSNGALEGMNNKIKMISHRAFGYRSVNNYVSAIYHCCADLPL